MPLSKRIKIHGKVQGVFFRESMRQEASLLGITGWVRNCRDGSVEAVVQGSESGVEKILAWAAIGPPLANVEKIETEDALDEPAWPEFTRRETK